MVEPEATEVSRKIRVWNVHHTFFLPKLHI
jgi:hypothetical protein